ncbi:hypothetical protein [Arthrobacter sp. lap29]|nr:hypothetical protein [Arthrobacter sp. lap29]
MLGNTSLAGTDSVDDVAARYRPVAFQVPEDFAAAAIAEGLDGRFDI